MQMVKKFFILLFIAWFALLFFMPKQELYYTLEKELAQQGVEINEESINEGIFSLTINNASVYVKGIKIATIEKVSFFTLLFYTKAEIDNLLLDDSLKAMAPQHTDKVLLTHSLLSVWTVPIHAEGSFGVVDGYADLKARKVRLNFIETKEIDSIKSQLKKDKKGWYYETSF